jgi:hypothetical protein
MPPGKESLVDISKFLGDEIDSKLEDFKSSISRLADEYRERVLIPLCREHRLTYRDPKHSLNHLLVFTHLDGNGLSYYCKLDAHTSGAVYLIDIYTVLHKHIFTREFGSYIFPVVEQDYYITI